MFNTNDLGYKLVSDKINGHSEQLNKYVAGLLDADGCVSLHFKKHSNDRYSIYLQVSLTLSGSTDPDAEVIRALQRHYQLGQVYHYTTENLISRSSTACWSLNNKDSQILLGRIAKHLLIKGTHADNLLWLITSLRGFSIPGESINELKEFSKCSRSNSSWLKLPKHPKWAWLAGYIDGDGHYRCRIQRKRIGHYHGKNELKLFVGCSPDDAHILEFLHAQIGGTLRLRKDGVWFWQLALGKGSRLLATPFLKKMRQYSCLYNKYKIICNMLDFHLSAETKQQPPERVSDSPV